MKYEIGSKIRHFREKRGLNQKELASRIGVSNSRVSNWEQGINRPDADTLVLLCQALEVSADELLDINISSMELAPLDEIARIYGKLNADNRKYLQGYVHRLLEEQSTDEQP